MYYPNNYDGYMQDFYFYNQNPNTYMNFNPGFMPNYNSAHTINLSYYYPSLYKILMPVIIRVIQNSNFQFLNEEVINNIVDTVYSIVEGDVIQPEPRAETANNINQQNGNSQTNKPNNSNRDNELLKDIIKILVIKELQNRQIRQLNQAAIL